MRARSSLAALVLTFTTAGCGGGAGPIDAAAAGPDALGLDAVSIDALAPDALAFDAVTADAPSDALDTVDALAPVDASAPDAPRDAASTLDAPGAVDAGRADDVGPRPDVGPPPGCVSLALAAYTGAFDVTPVGVAAREASAGWTVVAGGASSTAVYASTLTGTPGPNTLLFDETGFSSVARLTSLAMHAMPGGDDVRIYGNLGDRVMGWTGTTGRAHFLATGTVLAAARLGDDSLVVMRETGRPVVLRLGSTGTELPATVSEDRAVSLAPNGTGALVALAQGSRADACDVIVLDAAGTESAAVHVPTGAGPCDAVAVTALDGAALDGVSAALAYVADGELWYRTIDVGSGTLGALLALGPALAGPVAVWPDATGGARAVWRSTGTQLRSVAVSAEPAAGETTCITGPASLAWAGATSARQGATTIVLVQGGGRSGEGLQYATLTDR